jgi:hypothetical protein
MKKKRKGGHGGRRKNAAGDFIARLKIRSPMRYEQLDKARLMVRLIECRFLRSNPRPEQGGLPTRSSAVAVFSRDG